MNKGKTIRPKGLIKPLLSRLFGGRKRLAPGERLIYQPKVVSADANTRSDLVVYNRIDIHVSPDFKQNYSEAGKMKIYEEDWRKGSTNTLISLFPNAFNSMEELISFVTDATPQLNRESIEADGYLKRRVREYFSAHAPLTGRIFRLYETGAQIKGHALRSKPEAVHYSRVVHLFCPPELEQFEITEDRKEIKNTAGEFVHTNAPDGLVDIQETIEHVGEATIYAGFVSERRVSSSAITSKYRHGTLLLTDLSSTALLHAHGRSPTDPESPS